MKRPIFRRGAALDEGRVFRSGLYAAAIAAAAVALVVLVNLLARALPARFTRFDLSEGGLYTLSESSRAVAESIGQDVTIYYLCETGREDAILTGLLDQYAAAGSHIHWETRDPALYPTFASQYGAGDTAAGSLIVDAGARSAVLNAADLYLYEYTDYETGSYTVRFDGEGQITSALYRLTSGEASRAYYTTNHGERALSASLVSALEAQNIEVEGLNLLTAAIPDDCALLIVHCPAQDFTGAEGAVDELAALRAYLAGGGRLLLVTDAYYDTPGLDGVMAEFGLARVEGLVVESDPDHYLYGYSYYLLPERADPAQSTALDGVDPGAYLLLPMAQGIEITQADGVAVEPLLRSSAHAYSKAAGYDMATVEQEEGDPDGPFALAAWARDEGSGAEAIWLGCANMDDESLYLSVPANCDFLVSCAASLTGQAEGIVVQPKELEAARLAIPAAAASALGLAFLLATPAALLAAGAAITIRRRRR